MRASRSHATVATVLAFAGVASGCGDDKKAERSTFDLNAKATWQKKQSISKPVTLKIVVTNPGSRTVPNVNVSVAPDGTNASGSGFSNVAGGAGSSDPRRPIWIVDQEPRNGATTNGSTWALGPLRPGAQRDFIWRLTPAQVGTFKLRWRVSGDLTGDARVEDGNGGPLGGRLTAKIDRVARQSGIDPDTGKIVTGED